MSPTLRARKPTATTSAFNAGQAHQVMKKGLYHFQFLLQEISLTVKRVNPLCTSHPQLSSQFSQDTESKMAKLKSRFGVKTLKILTKEHAALLAQNQFLPISLIVTIWFAILRLQMLPKSRLGSPFRLTTNRTHAKTSITGITTKPSSASWHLVGVLTQVVIQLS